jgi:hypothetical protein
MSEEQKILMFTENYNIYKILDNTILGFFAGIISGIEIEAFMNGASSLLIIIIFNILCIFSIVSMLFAIDINSKFIQRCKDAALLQTEYQDRKNIINKLADETKKLQVKFNQFFWLSIILLFVGIVILKIPLFQELSNTPHVVCHCQCNNSVQNENCEEYILNCDTLKQQNVSDCINKKVIAK